MDVYLMNLSGNQLSGEIPEEIGNLRELKYLNLSSNNLTGAIPDEIGNLFNLISIDLSCNQLVGKIPSTIGKLVNLEILDLYQNELSGELPNSFGDLESLTETELYDNKIEGKLPESIGNLLNLKVLSLSKNNLSGEIPHSFERLKDLETLSIGQNNLSGEIPHSFENLKSLATLGLSNNNLSGEIPQFIWNIENLKNLELDRNSFTGELPQAIKNQKLEFLNIEQNNLSGTIPEWIGELPLLTVCHLSQNYFEGSIPLNVSQCPNWKLWTAELNIIPQKNGYNLAVDHYISTDFSKDGEVIVLQKHTKGNGIKIVLMGDMFVDTDMENNGVYETKMKEAMEAFFSVEPTKSLRELFDVLCIKAVSKNDFIGGETVFSTSLSTGSELVFDLDFDQVKEYAKKAIENINIDDVLTIMILNTHLGYRPSCFFLENRANVACCPVNQIDAMVITHEAAGHGFGLLQDEYIYSGKENEAIPDYEIEIKIEDYNTNGYWANIDFTNDPTKVKWACFIVDPRYVNEEIGVYEGALWGKGIYRPTLNNDSYNISIMGGAGTTIRFNAPSREAIYKRAMKLAYGDSWTYDYEEFVKFDAPTLEEINREAESRSVLRPKKAVLHDAPPIFYNSSK